MNAAPLVDITEIVMGQSPPSSTYNTKGEGLPFFQGKTDFGDLYPKLRIFCTEPTKIALPNDILISVRAPVGPTNIAQVKSGLGRGLAAIRCGNNLDCTYLLYFLRFYEPQLAQLGKGSTFEAVNRGDLERIVVPLPSLEDQRRIAQILESADQLRRQRRYAQELNDSFLQSVFIQMFGDPIKNPNGWDVVTVGDVCLQITDGVHATPKYLKSGIPFISTVNVTERGIDWSQAKFISEREHEALIKRCKPESGDLLYTKVGTVGISLPILDRRPFSIFVQLALLKVEQSKCLFRFLNQMLNMPSVRHSITSKLTGATMKYIGIGDIGRIKIVLPPLEEQEKFVRALESFERVQLQQKEAARQAEHLFETLLHRAFLGEL